MLVAVCGIGVQMAKKRTDAAPGPPADTGAAPDDLMDRVGGEHTPNLKHGLYSKTERAQRRKEAFRAEAEREVDAILRQMGLVDDALAQRIGRRLNQAEVEGAVLERFCERRGRYDAKTGALKPAYERMLDLRQRDLADCNKLLDRLAEAGGGGGGSEFVVLHRLVFTSRPELQVDEIDTVPDDVPVPDLTPCERDILEFARKRYGAEGVDGAPLIDALAPVRFVWNADDLARYPLILMTPQTCAKCIDRLREEQHRTRQGARPPQEAADGPETGEGGAKASDTKVTPSTRQEAVERATEAPAAKPAPGPSTPAALERFGRGGDGRPSWADEKF